MSDMQNIAVIGGEYFGCEFYPSDESRTASHAGISFANKIVNDLPGNYRILLIDGLDYAFWPLKTGEW